MSHKRGRSGGPRNVQFAAWPDPVCQDRVDSSGRVTLRYLRRLRHRYVGRAHRGERIRVLAAGADVRVIRENGQLLGQTTWDANRNYQPLR